MRIRTELCDPNVVVVSQSRVPDLVSWEDYRRSAWQAMAAMEVELEGEKGVIKPNVTVGERYANPDSGIGTHPAFVRGLVEYLQGHGVRRGGIYILEDPRDTDDNEPRHWRGTGYAELAQETGAKLRCPATYTCVKKTVPRPLVHRTLNVSRLAVGPNTVLLNVPKLKTHNLSITTLCLKNLMGAVNVFDRHFCVQAWREMPEEIRDNKRPRSEWMDCSTHERWHEGLARRLADTAQVVRPHLNIVEGIVAREGTGFERGNNRALGLVVAGVNMVAVDSVASYLMGFDPQCLLYLRVAAEAGLGCNDLGRLCIYSVQDGSLAPCASLETLRTQPSLRVISNIAGEEQWDR
jgi:uncharacterized protein (DUF362 family)